MLKNMLSHRGVTWGIIPRPIGIATAVVVLLAASVSGTFAAAAPPSSPASPYVAGSDPYSMASVTALLGAQAWWDAGYTGAGVDVALIDSGVAPVQGLTASGKIINGPDLSLESQSPALRNLDTYGHGTFMAGLIAGRDDNAATPPPPIATRFTGAWRRMRESSASRWQRPTAAPTSARSLPRSTGSSSTRTTTG